MLWSDSEFSIQLLWGDDGEHPERARDVLDALQDAAVERLNPAAHAGLGLLRDQDLALAGVRLQPLGEVDGRPQDRELVPGAAADVPHQYLAGVDAAPQANVDHLRRVH